MIDFCLNLDMEEYKICTNYDFVCVITESNVEILLYKDFDENSSDNGNQKSLTPKQKMVAYDWRVYSRDIVGKRKNAQLTTFRDKEK